MCRSWWQWCTKEPGAWVQPFKAFVLTALQKDMVRVASVTVMTQMCKLQDQPTEVGRWRKLELTSATAGTLKSGLPALCRSAVSNSRKVVQCSLSAWISCLPVIKLCHTDCQLDGFTISQLQLIPGKEVDGRCVR